MKIYMTTNTKARNILKKRKFNYYRIMLKDLI